MAIQQRVQPLLLAGWLLLGGSSHAALTTYEGMADVRDADTLIVRTPLTRRLAR